MERHVVEEIDSVLLNFLTDYKNGRTHFSLLVLLYDVFLTYSWFTYTREWPQCTPLIVNPVLTIFIPPNRCLMTGFHRRESRDQHMCLVREYVRHCPSSLYSPPSFCWDWSPSCVHLPCVRWRRTLTEEDLNATVGGRRLKKISDFSLVRGEGEIWEVTEGYVSPETNGT